MTYKLNYGILNGHILRKVIRPDYPGRIVSICISYSEYYKTVSQLCTSFYDAFYVHLRVYS